MHSTLILLWHNKLKNLVILTKNCLLKQYKCMKIEFLFKKYRHLVEFLVKCILKQVYCSPDIPDFPIKIYFVEVCYEKNYFEKA